MDYILVYQIPNQDTHQFLISKLLVFTTYETYEIDKIPQKSPDISLIPGTDLAWMFTRPYPIIFK